MNELQLVGYTADLKYLVFSDVADGARFKVPVDDDLVATLGEVMQLIDPDREPFLGAAESEPPHWPDEWAPGDAAPAPAPQPPAPAEPEKRNGRRSGPKAGQGPLAAFAVLADPAPRAGSRSSTAGDDDKGGGSKLSPREIQALLRSGLTPRQVARRAETDDAWVQRWLAPIEAERRLILQAVEQARVTKSRLGESRDLLGEAVRKNLAEKGLGSDDDSIEWQASKREGDTHWSVTLIYRSRGKKQRALWHFNPDTGELDPRNALAVDVAWTRPRKGRGRAATVSAPTRKTLTAKKGPSAKKGSAAKKTAAAKKAADKRAAAAKKKPAAKKPAAKKPAAKKAAAKKPAAKKPAAKKAAAKKPVKKAAATRKR